MKSSIQKTSEMGTDCRIKFRRPSDNSIYCIMAPATVARLRKSRQLEKYLVEQRESGIVIRTTRD